MHWPRSLRGLGGAAFGHGVLGSTCTRTGSSAVSSGGLLRPGERPIAPAVMFALIAAEKGSGRLEEGSRVANAAPTGLRHQAADFTRLTGVEGPTRLLTTYMTS